MTAVCVLLACVLLLREGLPGASGLELLAAGASFPAGLYQDAVFAYQFVQPNVSVSYLPTGSSKGKCRIKVCAILMPHTRQQHLSANRQNHRSSIVIGR